MANTYAVLMDLSQGYWIAKSTGKVAKTDATRKPLLEGKVGMYLLEGISAYAALLEAHLAYCGKDQAGFKHAYIFEEEGYELGGLQTGHYGMVQKALYKIFNMGFNKLPMVDYVICTAFSCAAKDKTTSPSENQQRVTYGPMGCGTADTAKIPGWFQDSFYLDTVEIKGKPTKVAWFKDHIDPDTDIVYPAKVRIRPQLIPLLDEKYPNGFVKLGYSRGLDKLYSTLATLNNTPVEIPEETLSGE
jgi:hypothetical protein